MFSKLIKFNLKKVLKNKNIKYIFFNTKKNKLTNFSNINYCFKKC